GIGIGLTMQVIVVAVQNVLEPRDLGIGTSANTFMRQMGGVFGVGIFGAYFAHRVIALAKGAGAIAAQNGVDPRTIGSSFRATPGAVHDYPAPLRDYITGGFADIVGHIFLFAAPVMLLAWVVVLFLKEIPLRTARNVGGSSGATPGAQGTVARNIEKTGDAVSGAPVALAPRNGAAGALPTNGHSNGNGGAVPRRGPAPGAVVAFDDRAGGRQWYMGYEISDLQSRVDHVTRQMRR
ncbi:MAG: hypothetical protein QOJ26_1915, partial [Thermoplasmata archaeon]|nr:hypothetical protein [Thermoplasmata archaeon]